MKVLVIGGTGFIGRPLVRQMAEFGHSVTVLHRGSALFDLPAREVLGDRRDLPTLSLEPDVVIDLILSSGAQADAMMQAFRGRAGRVVAASSIDVYRAVGILHGSEEGPPEPVPLTEQSRLRTKLQTYPPAQIKALQGVFGWVDDAYDKIPVEAAVLGYEDLPGTILRLPMVYGPGDRLRRFDSVLKRIDDGREVILLEEGSAAWRASRGYVENVASALALAAISDQSAGRIYNVAEQPAYSELEWSRRIACAAGWTGGFVILPREDTPAHLRFPGNPAQHWEADSSRIRAELGYVETVPLEEALRRTIDWERVNPPNGFVSDQFDYAAEDAALAKQEHGRLPHEIGEGTHSPRPR